MISNLEVPVICSSVIDHCFLSDTAANSCRRGTCRTNRDGPERIASSKRIPRLTQRCRIELRTPVMVERAMVLLKTTLGTRHVRGTLQTRTTRQGGRDSRNERP